MTDLRTMLHEAAGSAGRTATASVDADLARARQALSRRRRGRLGAGTALVAAVTLGVGLMVNPALLTGTRPSPASATSIRLVAYTGKQPVGFTLDEVPAGWRVDRVDTDTLGLVPEGGQSAPPPPAQTSAAQRELVTIKRLQVLRDQNTISRSQLKHLIDLQNRAAQRQGGYVPGAGNSPQTTDIGYSMVGKVVVSLSEPGSVSHNQPVPVTVNGRPGWIAQMLGGQDEAGARTLFVKQPGGRYLTIQVWSGLPWTDADTVRLANGIHITKDARAGVG